MASRMLRNFSFRPASTLGRSFQQRSVAPAVLIRTYVATNESSPGQSSNVSQPHANSAEGQQVNQSRVMDDKRGSPDTASVQTPVSNPEESGLGGQEEPTRSQDEMKRDPEEPDSVKREKVLEHGQSKKLDPADD